MTAVTPNSIRIYGPEDGQFSPGAPGLINRFIVESDDTDGRFVLLEHRLDPGVLAAPMHLHTREDEYSFVLEGRMGAVLGDKEAFASAGDLVFKPRDQWHTFWNAGDGPLRLLELVSPAGIEELFRGFADTGGLPDPETLGRLAARYGCRLDFEATMPIVERHGLAL